MALDKAFCHTCIKAIKLGKISATKSVEAFSKTEFQNWKKALEKNSGLAKHNDSDSHKKASEDLMKASNDVGELLDDQMTTAAKNQKVLRKILESIRFLARQSLSFRGNWSNDSKSEENSNFHQLLLLRSLDYQDLEKWLNSGSNKKYTSPEIQNEILKIMSLQVLREIAQNIQSSVIYTIMAGETAEISNKEQLVFCIRWDDNNLTPHEEFIGMYHLVNTSADHIVLLIKDILLRINLKIENARGQCYDGASVMAGTKSGVVTRLKISNGKSLFRHCYGHVLNLAVGDVIRNLKDLKEIF